MLSQLIAMASLLEKKWKPKKLLCILRLISIPYGYTRSFKRIACKFNKYGKLIQITTEPSWKKQTNKVLVRTATVIIKISAKLQAI